MTCVVGIKLDGHVLLAADSLGASGTDCITRKDAKVFRRRWSHERPWLAIGSTTSFRMHQLLRYELDAKKTTQPFVTTPLLINDADYVDEWAVTIFVPAARQVLKDHAFTKISDNQEEAGTFLLAIGPHLFVVDSDWQVGRWVQPYAAVGCGDRYALGVLYACGERATTDARASATLALEAAAEFSSAVRGPWAFVTTDERDGDGA